MRRVDARAHRHPAWWAYLVHRLSGLALGLFLPLHFWALAQALKGEAGLEGFLRFADQPLVKFAEWGLVLLLALHAAGGVRLLLIEFGPWSGLRKNWIAASAGFGLAASLAFALALLD
jgi:fumarate reductase subunit D